MSNHSREETVLEGEAPQQNDSTHSERQYEEDEPISEIESSGNKENSQLNNRFPVEEVEQTTVECEKTKTDEHKDEKHFISAASYFATKPTDTSSPSAHTEGPPVVQKSTPLNYIHKNKNTIRIDYGNKENDPSTALRFAKQTFLMFNENSINNNHNSIVSEIKPAPTTIPQTNVVRNDNNNEKEEEALLTEIGLLLPHPRPYNNNNDKIEVLRDVVQVLQQKQWWNQNHNNKEHDATPLSQRSSSSSHVSSTESETKNSLAEMKSALERLQLENNEKTELIDSIRREMALLSTQYYEAQRAALLQNSNNSNNRKGGYYYYKEQYEKLLYKQNKTEEAKHYASRFGGI
ncbi:hypothetical protein AGDE_16893 [Angomonas deanei]|uniref:Uncharacterized protein n=1 Tax=Angomonas deanei TaxID=59799 RepID=A0A7G2CGA9_9TRYP|nr:hypothetical protein AGDE_16893 [Angomonas deanei]CAD2217222.1 hypothetical protein, conserved [Angomonas deanei]|eukprot:EPY15956.1 hypothetical protein AGDE_16893 [Angomonas deanei]